MRAWTAISNASESPWRLIENFTERRLPGSGDQVACQNVYSVPFVVTVILETPTTPDEFRWERWQMRARSSPSSRSSRVLRHARAESRACRAESCVPSAKNLAYLMPLRCSLTCHPCVHAPGRSIRAMA